MATSFFHAGGDIIWHAPGGKPRYMSEAAIQEQLDLFQREHDACLRKGLRMDARVARSLFLDLTDAVKQRDAWMRCASVQRLRA